MYSAGRVIQNIINHEFLAKLPSEQRLAFQSIVSNCQCPRYSDRPSAKLAVRSFQELMLK